MFESKAVQVPTLTYDAIKDFALKNKITMKEAARRILFYWTLIYWSEYSDPGDETSTSESPD